MNFKLTLAFIAFFICLITGTTIIAQESYRATDDHLRERVVFLINPNKGSCTGEQVQYKGKNYVLTAAHCEGLSVDNKIQAYDSHHHLKFLTIIKESTTSDLLLLSGFDEIQGLDLADFSLEHEHIRFITHGKGHKAYKTEGELLETTLATVLIGQSFDKHAKGFCKDMPKFQIREDVLPMFDVHIYSCVMITRLQFTQAMIVPGSSGGPAVNDSGELVGVVSAGDGQFGLVVPISEIQRFFKNL